MDKRILAIPALGIAATGFAAVRPNVVLVLADDMGYGDMSALNPGSKIHTGNLDDLASHGVLFTDAHASSSLSTPSRYSLLTGRYSWRSGMHWGVFNGYHQGAMIEEGRKTLGTMFSRSGYHTACIGKWHLGWNWTLRDVARNNRDVDFSKPVRNGVTTRGFDHFFGIVASLDMPPYVYVNDDMPTAVPDHVAPGMDGVRLFRSGPMARDFRPEECLETFFRKGEEYITAHKGSGTPFFLYLPLNAPHTPVLPSKEYEGRSGIGPYGDYIIMMDDLIGHLVRTLKDNGQWDNTVFIFATDNGCATAIDVSNLERQGHYPSHIYRGYKRDIYDGGHRVPLLVTWGDSLMPHRDSSLICLSDIYATMAEMLGYRISPDEAEDSFSFWGNLTGGGRSRRKDIVHLSGRGPLAIREKGRKLIFHAGSGGDSYPTDSELDGLPPMQLYDMYADPSEKVNLSSDKRNTRLIKRLSRRMRRYVDTGRSTPGKAQKVPEADRNWEYTTQF
ncbi:MAG: arylsulfatase [Bacteroidales bacterium]|nr:arylsulfatase [Bacteroidales bacterium]